MANKEFAVIETGGKQYTVAVGDTLRVEIDENEYQAGDTIVFDSVLLKHDGKETTVGTPYVDGSRVEALFASQGKGKKIPVIQFMAKSRHFLNRGHRQPYREVTIKAIS